MIDRGPGGTTGHPDLSALVRGEAGNQEILAASRHLDECARCRSDLTHVVTSHALLARSSEVMSDDSDADGVTGSGAAGPPSPTVLHRSRRPEPLLAMLCVAAALGVGVIVWVGTRPTPGCAFASRFGLLRR